MDLDKVQYFEDPWFCGSETFYVTTAVRNLVATEGIKTMFDKLKCYWIGDHVMSYLHDIKSKVDVYGNFFVVRVIVSEDKSASFVVDDGNENLVISRRVDFTDLSQNVRFYLTFDSFRWTMLLPTEY